MDSAILDALEKNNHEQSHDLKAAFYAEGKLELSDVKVSVKEFGDILFPLTSLKLQQLLKIASLAKYGLREKTLLDTTVRNTYEIPKDQLSVHINENNFKHLLSKMHGALGLSENTTLNAHLHNLLIYNQGQFFKTHQDTEKYDGMIATLVIVLPSSHIGGDLIIHHKNHEHHFSSENIISESLKCISFYADCQHEVCEVKQGYRIALTYNIVLKSKDSKHNQTSHSNNDSLEKALQNYFNSENDVVPHTMTYFLDHDYTEHGLQWEMLKGIDIKNALSFRKAAQQLNLRPHLALVEVHESWSTDGGYDEDDVELVELIDSDVTLSFWRDHQNKLLPYESYIVDEDEIFFTKDTKEFSPKDTEFEGYMGNYGGDMQYWYRRAAVVLWREENQIKMEFLLCYDIAFADLVALTQSSGNEKKVSTILELVGDDIYRSKNYIEKNDFELFMHIAGYINNETTALKLLSPFRLTMISNNLIDAIVILQKAYSAEWCLNLLHEWKNSALKASYDRHEPILYLDHIISESIQKLDNALIHFLLSYQLDALLKMDASLMEKTPVAIAVETKKRVDHNTEFLKACFLFIDSNVLVKKWGRHLIATPQLYSALELGEIIFYFYERNIAAPTYCLYAFNELSDHLETLLSDELQNGLRDEQDWSINVIIKPHCDYCKILSLFLRSKTEVKKIWSIAQDIRSHITHILKDFGLPLDIDVLKSGSPHKLILQKTNQLHRRAKERFDRLIKYNDLLKNPTL